MQGPFDTFAELAVLGAIFSILIGGGLWLRSKMKPGTGGAVVVVVSAVIAMAIGWIVLAQLHARRDHQRLDRAITDTLNEECKRPVPSAPNLVAMHELMCSPDVRYADLRTADSDVVVTIHGDLVGAALPRLPAGKTYKVALVDASGQEAASFPIDPTAPFSYLRDGHVPGTQKVRLYGDDKTLVEAALKR